MHSNQNTRQALRRLRGQFLFLTGLLCAVACAAMIHNVAHTSSVGDPGLVIAAAMLAAATLALRSRVGAFRSPAVLAEPATGPEL